MSEKLKYYSYSMFFLFLSNLISSIFLLISRITIARFASPELFGYVSIIISEAQIISLFLSLGLYPIIRIELPRSNNREKHSLIFSSILYFSIFSIFSLIISFIFFFINSESTYFYSFLVSTVLIFFNLIIAILMGLKKFSLFFVCNFIQGVIFFLLLLYFRNDLNLASIVNSLFLSYLISFFIPFFILFFKYKKGIKKYIQYSDFKVKKIFKFNKQRFFIFSIMIVNSIHSYLVVKIPEFLGYVEDSAYLSISRGIATFLIIIPNVVSSSIGPIISKNYSLKKEGQINQVLRDGLTIIYFLIGICVIVFAFYGDFIIIILYGGGYLKSVGIIYYIFLIGIVTNSLAIIFSIFLLNSRQEKRYAIGRYFLLISFFISVIVLLLISNQVSITLSISFIVGYIAELIVYIYYIHKKNQNINLNLRNLSLWLIFIISSIFLGMFCSLIQNFTQITKFIILSVNIVIFILFASITKLIKFKEIYKILGDIIQKKKRKKEVEK